MRGFKLLCSIIVSVCVCAVTVYRWDETKVWFKAHWLPSFSSGAGVRLAGISKKTEDKIDLSTDGVAATKAKSANSSKKSN